MTYTVTAELQFDPKIFGMDKKTLSGQEIYNLEEMYLDSLLIQQMKQIRSEESQTMNLNERKKQLYVD